MSGRLGIKSSPWDTGGDTNDMPLISSSFFSISVMIVMHNSQYYFNKSEAVDLQNRALYKYKLPWSLGFWALQKYERNSDSDFICLCAVYLKLYIIVKSLMFSNILYSPGEYQSEEYF